MMASVLGRAQPAGGGLTAVTSADEVTPAAPKRRWRSRGGLVTIGTVLSLVAGLGLTVLGLGVRYVLLVYPLAALALGVCARAAPRRLVTGLVLVALESLAAHPHELAFFNRLAGGPGGGADYLAESNLDWGQDLKELAKWQQQNPSRKLYLSYFGVADPQYYGVRATHLPGGYIFASTPPQNPVAGEPAVIAVSATNLQGIYYSPTNRDRMKFLQSRKPIAVLGGSFYLFDWNPDEFRAQIQRSDKP